MAHAVQRAPLARPNSGDGTLRDPNPLRLCAQWWRVARRVSVGIGGEERPLHARVRERTVAALGVLFEHNFVEALAGARVADALGSSSRARPVRLRSVAGELNLSASRNKALRRRCGTDLDWPPLKRLHAAHVDCSKAAHNPSFAVAIREELAATHCTHSFSNLWRRILLRRSRSFEHVLLAADSEAASR